MEHLLKMKSKTIKFRDMDAILYIQAAREELVENQDLRHTIDETIAEANKASFRPPHPSNAAQIDWDDHVAPV